jgi:hypothetical protein
LAHARGFDCTQALPFYFLNSPTERNVPKMTWRGSSGLLEPDCAPDSLNRIMAACGACALARGERCLIDDATQDIAAQIATDVVIIEDEPLIALDLQAVVQSLGHRVVGVGSLPGRREALAVHCLILATLAAAGVPESAVNFQVLTNEVSAAA